MSLVGWGPGEGWNLDEAITGLIIVIPRRIVLSLVILRERGGWGEHL